MGIIRKTKSVKAVLREFDESNDAVSVVDLVEDLQGEMNKSTVYRILERLQDDGILHSFTGREGLTWYAKCSDCTTDTHIDAHPHFQCSKCGKVECLEFKVPIPKLPHHKVDTTEFLMVGQCAQCRN